MINLALLGSRIKELRIQKGLTQGEFAKILSVSFQAVSNWERGVAPPDIENLMNISSYFGVLIDTLLSPVNEDLYLGVDGGGTKTEFVLTTAEGNVLKRVLMGGCNPNDVGFSETEKIITSGLNAILTEFPSVKSIFCGVSGISTGNYGERLSASLKKAYPQAKIKVQSDAFNLFGIYDEAEVALISGTGSVAFVKTGEEYKRLGGWGHLFDSAGSAYDIGRAAIVGALSEEDARKEPSKISLLLREKTNASSVWEHIDSLYRGGKSYIASFASLVFEAYAEGDSKAFQIIDENAKALAELLNKAVNLYGVKPIAIASGGLFEHFSDILISHIKRYSEVKVLVSDLPPIYGASRKACEKLSSEESDGFYQNFKKTYGEISVQ